MLGLLPPLRAALLRCPARRVLVAARLEVAAQVVQPVSEAVLVPREGPVAGPFRRRQARRRDLRRTAGQGNQVPQLAGLQTVRYRSATEVVPPMEVAAINQPATVRPAQVATGSRILHRHRFGLLYLLLAAIAWQARDLKASGPQQVSQQHRFQLETARLVNRELERLRRIRASMRRAIRGPTLLRLPAVRRCLPVAVRCPTFSRSALLPLEIHARRLKADFHLARGERRGRFPVPQIV
ncbi:MAG TPA: hypothetical protein VKX49_03270 [Bryobacteraceae bacterium]|nr:hypothetical protein [Bryobacteraceae bacterium]